MTALAIGQHESAIGIHVSPSAWTPSPPISTLSLRLSQSGGPGFSALCIELSLVTQSTYGNVQVSMLFSQIIPPSPSPTESRSLFFMSVSPWLPCMCVCFFETHVGSKLRPHSGSIKSLSLQDLWMWLWSHHSPVWNLLVAFPGTWRKSKLLTRSPEPSWATLILQTGLPSTFLVTNCVPNLCCLAH